MPNEQARKPECAAARSPGTARIETSDGPEWNHLGERTVAEAMTPSVWSVTSDTPVRDAARVMLDNRIHRVLVVDAGRLIGIVSSSDIVRAVADKGLCD